MQSGPFLLPPALLSLAMRSHPLASRLLFLVLFCFAAALWAWGCAPRIQPAKTQIPASAPLPPTTTQPAVHVPNLTDLERSAKSHPKDAKAQARYGSALVESGQASAGIARLRRAVALDPKLTAAWHNLGLAAERQGWLDVAADAYGHVVTARPDHAGEWIKLGYVLIQLGRFEEAEHAFHRAAALQPHASEPLVAQASSDYALFHFNAAVSTLQQALALNPRSAAAQADLASIQFEVGNHEAAETAIRAALALEPDSARHALVLGRILASSPLPQKRAEAQQTLEQVLNQSQQGGPTALDAAGQAEAYSLLGSLAERAGKHEAAPADWRRALALDPTRTEAMLALGQALARRGGAEAAEGRKLLEEYRRRQTLRDNERKLQQQTEEHPTDGEARLRYGTLLLEQGQTAHAVWELREAVLLRPQDASARRAWAEALRRQGRDATTEPFPK